MQTRRHGVRKPDEKDLLTFSKCHSEVAEGTVGAQLRGLESL